MSMPQVNFCDPASSFFGLMGLTSAVVFSNLGAAYGTAKSGCGIYSMGVMKPHLVMKSLIPVLMAGVLGIYGLILGIMLNTSINNKPEEYSSFQGYSHLAAGLVLGLSSLASGLCIGVVGDAGVRANAQNPKLFTGMILILVFAEALSIYGLILGIMITTAPIPKLCTPLAGGSGTRL